MQTPTYPKEATFRVMTYNIRFGAGAVHPERPGYDLPATRETIRALCAAADSVRPDIIALQEVRGIRQAASMARELAMSYVYVSHGAGYSLSFFEWGLAVLHRYHVAGTFQEWIRFDPETRTGRLGLGCRLSMEGMPATLLNVHFSSESPAPQVKAALDIIRNTETPVILAGDFNCEPESDVMQPIRERLADTCRAIDTPESAEALATGTCAARRIDAILVDPRAYTVRNAGLIPEKFRGASDHIGYFTDISIRTSGVSPSSGRAPA